MEAGGRGNPFGAPGKAGGRHEKAPGELSPRGLESEPVKARES